MRYNKTNLDFFEKIDTESKAYWLGFFVADGYISAPKYRHGAVLTFNLSAVDGQHLQKFADIFDVPLKHRTSRDKNGIEHLIVRCDVCSNRIYFDIINKGIPTPKTFNYINVFPHIPTELIHHFIRGVFDGDGSISGKSMRRSLFTICGNHSFIADIKRIMINALHLSNVKTSTSPSNISILVWGGNDQLVKIRNWLYGEATIYLERKRNRFMGVTLNNRKSKYRGVQPAHHTNRWEVSICTNYKNIYIGTFDTQEEAAIAYNDAAIKYHGDRAILNDISGHLLTIKGGEHRKYKDNG